MFAVRRMKIELLVSMACSSSITGSNSVEERLALLQPARRQVGGHAAGRDVAVGQPCAAKLLEKVEDLLAFAEAPHEGRETAQVEAIAAGGRQGGWRCGPIRRPRPAGGGHVSGGTNPSSFSTASAQPRFMFMPGQVIEPVGIGDELPRREVLADLLRTAVQVADMRRQIADHFAVGPQHQPQHAVRARMLRAHVDQHLVAAEVEFDQVRDRCVQPAFPILPAIP